jgi:hypothetical protein
VPRFRLWVALQEPLTPFIDRGREARHHWHSDGPSLGPSRHKGSRHRGGKRRGRGMRPRPLAVRPRCPSEPPGPL